MLPWGRVERMKRKVRKGLNKLTSLTPTSAAEKMAHVVQVAATTTTIHSYYTCTQSEACARLLCRRQGFPSRLLAIQKSMDSPLVSCIASTALSSSSQAAVTALVGARATPLCKVRRI